MPDPLGDITYTWPFYAAAAAGYLLGSLPFGLIITRLAGLGDIRAIGSGNIGATNVLRTGRKGLAALTLILDVGKGGIAAFAGGYFYGPDIAIMAGCGAFLGHLFPVWLKFRGGKGVAVLMGILTAFDPFLGLMCAVTWLIVAALSKYSSLASLVTTAELPLYALVLGRPQLAEVGIFFLVLVWLRHYGNIARLWRGEESRIHIGK